MYTQCPECLTIYKIGAAVLNEGHGSARCGHCAAVFDVLRTLTDQLPGESIHELERHAPGAAPPQLTVPALRPARAAQAQATLFDPDERPRPPSAPRRPHTPAFAKAHRKAPRARSWPWAVGAFVLLLSLAAEISYAERAELLDDARVRPLLDEACATLGCRLPLRHDPSKLELLSRDIRPHPSVPNALIISATLRNDADFPQAFPAVEITLSDLDENRIAMRRFLPQEYLGDSRNLTSGMAPGATAALVFEVADPGKNAVAFEFKFL
ncbi:MAG TPA: zinc-ribbon and DUF3426 domain-containing protein [Rudaea sp.]|nr:zinc-ribbon and DUF3426 domain-containing protein [Rudaea sp.]